jgi:hypothetical protein
MPSFKHKTNKNIVVNKKSITTLDSKHKETEQLFQVFNTHTAPELENELKELKKQLKSVQNLSITDILDKEERVKAIKKKLRQEKSKQTDYYLTNNKFIHTYFENKKDVSNNNNKTKLLNSFFKIEDKEGENSESITTNISQQYLINMDETFLDINKFIQDSDVCGECRKGELIPIEHEGIMVCNQCFVNVPYLVENEKPSYKEPPKEACFYAYKRINHFREILAQFQAKETTQIPDAVLDNIKNQIRKERIDLKNFDNRSAKEILKKLGYNKYYEHIPFIKDKLGIKPPVMSPELEESLCNLFMEIQAPYAKYCPDDRVNFLNYYYTVYKLCELLDQREFLPFFPMLKDREKRIEQDEIWKKICRELDWEFIPTL